MSQFDQRRPAKSEGLHALTVLKNGRVVKLHSGYCYYASIFDNHFQVFSGFTTETTNASGFRYFWAAALICSSVTASNFASSSSVRW